MILVSSLYPEHFPWQLEVTYKPRSLFNCNTIGGLSWIVPEPAGTHLQFPGLLFSADIIQHHQLSIHGSLGAVGAFSLLCYCGLEGDMCLQRMGHQKLIFAPRSWQLRTWQLPLVTHTGEQHADCIHWPNTLGSVSARAEWSSQQTAVLFVTCQAFKKEIQRLCPPPRNRGSQLWKGSV